MSILQVNRINFTPSGNTFISLDGTNNISIVSDNVQRVSIASNGQFFFGNAVLGNTNAVTPANNSSNTQIATTEFVQNVVSVKANINSPTFTGTPAAPTPSPAANTTQIATTEFVQVALGSISGLPSGSVLPFAGTSAPTGFLFCAGQEVSRTTFAALFTAIGTTYGVGNGSTTFNLPDLRGRVAAGVDNMGGTNANRITSSGSGITGNTIGSVGGTQDVTLTINEMPSHDHDQRTLTGGSAGTGTVNGATGTSNFTVIQPPTGLRGGGAAHRNVQPTIMLNYIIKT